MRPLRRGTGALATAGAGARFRFHCAEGFATQRLARVLHSLVRVSRRVGRSHSDANDLGASCRATATGARKTVREHWRAVGRAGTHTDVGTQPTPGRVGPRRACEGPQALSSVAISRLRRTRAVRSSPERGHLPRAPTEPEATAVGRLLAKVQGRRREPRTVTAEPRGLPPPAGSRRRLPEPDEEPLQLRSFPS